MRRIGCLLVGWVVLAAGCGAPSVVEVPKSYQNLKAIGLAYLQATQKLHRGPKNLSELRPFLEKNGDPEELLRSPNDGEDYEIRWNWNFYARRPGDQFPVLAYEKHGHWGKRYVLQGRDVHYLDEKQFELAAQIPIPKSP